MSALSLKDPIFLGRKDGQTKMVRVGDSVAVHSWSMAEQVERMV